jgi:hypothetical protein
MVFVTVATCKGTASGGATIGVRKRGAGRFQASKIMSKREELMVTRDTSLFWASNRCVISPEGVSAIFHLGIMGNFVQPP